MKVRTLLLFLLFILLSVSLNYEVIPTYLYFPLIFTLVFVMAYYIIKKIGIPLREISKALTTESASHLQIIKNDFSELGEIARLMEEFFVQKNLLIKEITERQQIEKQLQDAMAVKSDFISLVSHELRTPLAPIKEGLSIILDGLTGPINDEQRHLLEMSKRNATRLNLLINDVLDFQKLESGKMNFEFEPNDMALVAQEVYDNMKLLAEQKGITFHLAVAPALPLVVFDKNKIFQVLSNLVNNAIKFTEKGGIQISAEMEGQHLLVTVKDTGFGIQSEDIPKLFESFQ